MKKIILLILLLLPILLLTGCNNNENKIEKAIKSTSIKEKGLKSYRIKVDVKNKDKSINYIVLNKENKELNFSTDSKEDDLDYDYTNTDIFIETLKDIKDVKEVDYDKTYDKYEFSISKEKLNKLLKVFNFKVEKDGNGYTLIDKDNHIYMVNYVTEDISVTVTYTRLNSVK